MEFVKNTLACSHCSKTLQSPVTLPCGETICKIHVNNEPETEYYCVTCNLNHSIPAGGFKINKILDEMLRSKISSLHFGDEYQSAVDALAKVNELIESFQLLKRDPHFVIDKAVRDIKDKIDIRREQLKAEIDKEAEKLIENVLK